MAGLGFKDFQVGEVLTSSDVDGYLMQQTVMRFADSGARGSALGTATGTAVALAEGMVSYRDDDSDVEVYDGSAWKSLVPAVLQVNSTTKTDTFASTLSAGASTAITGLSVSITPKYTSSKVLVIASVTMTGNGALLDRGLGIILKRGSTAIGIGAASGTRASVSSGGIQASVFSVSSVAAQHLDSPASTSAQTYSVDAFNADNSTRTLYVNRSNTDTDNSYIGRYASTITVMEVAG